MFAANERNRRMLYMYHHSMLVHLQKMKRVFCRRIDDQSSRQRKRSRASHHHPVSRTRPPLKRQSKPFNNNKYYYTTPPQHRPSTWNQGFFHYYFVDVFSFCGSTLFFIFFPVHVFLSRVVLTRNDVNAESAHGVLCN